MASAPNCNTRSESGWMASSAFPGESVSTVGMQLPPNPTYPLSRIRTKRFRALAIVGFIVACLIVAASVLCLVMSNRECFLSSPLWVGLIAVVNGNFGLAVICCKSNRCVLMTHFVLSVCSCVGVGGVCLVTLMYTFTGFAQLFHFILLVLSLTYFVCTVINCASICSMWNNEGGGCCGSTQTPAPPVVYLQANAAAPDGKAQIVYIPVKLQQGQLPMVLTPQQQATAQVQQPTDPPPPYKA